MSVVQIYGRQVPIYNKQVRIGRGSLLQSSNRQVNRVIEESESASEPIIPDNLSENPLVEGQGFRSAGFRAAGKRKMRKSKYINF